jgi:hypothetical protein
VEHIIHSSHNIIDTVPVSNIPNVKFNFGILEPQAHFLLLQLISAENSNFLEVLIEKIIDKIPPK